MKFIELSFTLKKTIIVNPDNILYIDPYENSTTIVFNTTNGYCDGNGNCNLSPYSINVIETYSEIQEKLKSL